MTRSHGFRTHVLLTILFSLVASTVLALPKITRTGRYLYSEDGSRFYIKGIAYQEEGNVTVSPDNPFGEPHDFVDPLSLPDACARDLPYLQQLGVNVVHVYSVDDALNHDACMDAFENAGIYTIVDLARPLNGSITRRSPTWSTNLLNQYLSTIDTFSKYDNVLAFTVGNEVVLGDSTHLAAFIKAAARDVKAYLKSKGSSALVAYGAIDGSPSWRGQLAEYLSCDLEGNNSGDTAIDMYGLNIYTWCGDSSFSSAYAGVTDAFADYNVVAYLNEFGCIDNPPRLWTDAQAIFSTDMSTVWSGGIAFSYFPARDGYGMVTISSDGSTVTTSDDFDRLVEEYGKVDLTQSDLNAPSQSSATESYPQCAGPTTDFVASLSIPNTPNEEACNCAYNSFGCTYSPKQADYSDTIRDLINAGCNLLGASTPAGSCSTIDSDGTTGVYGQFSGCSPIVKVSAVMNQYYYLNDRAAHTCDFAGNGTVSSGAPTSRADSDAAVTSCFANAAAVFTPTGPGTSAPRPTSTGTGGNTGGNGGNTGGNGGNNGGNNNNTGAAFSTRSFVGTAVILLLSAGLGAVLTLF